MSDAVAENSSEKGKDAVVSDKGKELLVVECDSQPAVEGEVMPQENYNHMYPKPLAKYKEVVDSSEKFMETLEKLHATMGTKFMIPTIGGRELDLHRLFVEVTSRGGLEKVIGDRRWREVTAVFSFPSTATNASFVLRKYYISLLHHYEQIYFFGLQGWNSPPTASLRAPSVTSVASEKSVETETLTTRKRRRNNGEFTPAGTVPGLSVPANREVIGVIDGKFDRGYFVTVMVGRQRLKGVLFHMAEQSAAEAAEFVGSAGNRVVRRRRRRKKLSKRDPLHPKPNRSGYNFFFAEQHARLKPLHPGKDREISKMIGDLWNKLTETEKAVYQERGVKDKERYRSEMAVYRERQKPGQVISNAVPIQQRPAEPEVVMEVADSKEEMDEGDLPSANQINSSTDGDSTDSEGKKLDEDSEETSPEVGGTATESASLAAEPSIEGEGFELRRRSLTKVEGEIDPPSSSEDVESKKVAELPADQQ